MSSFREFFENTKDNVSDSFSSTAGFARNIVFPYVVPMLLFVVLTPGLLLSLPATSKLDCSYIAPLPSDSDGVCTDGVYVDGSSGYGAELDTVCVAQKKCNSIGMSKTVSLGAAFIHGLLFAVLYHLLLVPYYPP